MCSLSDVIANSLTPKSIPTALPVFSKGSTVTSVQHNEQ